MKSEFHIYPAITLLFTKHQHQQVYGATVTRDNRSFISLKIVHGFFSDFASCVKQLSKENNKQLSKGQQHK